MKLTKRDIKKATYLSKYVRDEYNESRALLATFGSAGYLTFSDNIEVAVLALRKIGDTTLADLIDDGEWMTPCGSALLSTDKVAPNTNTTGEK